MSDKLAKSDTADKLADTKTTSRKDKGPSPDTSQDFRVVAIGASAGGLEALKEFFDNVPTGCRHSFVIVQHLSPDHKSLMAELLARNTTMPIYEIEDGMPVTKGGIYLIPPKKNMTYAKGKLVLVEKPEKGELNLPIDIFFKSLAKENREKSICIVLSGSGSDGTSGVRAIKEVGGMVMVQNPIQAKFDSMPQNAINTGLVDYDIPVEQMPAELIHYIDHQSFDGTTENQIAKDESTVNRILHQIRNVTSLDFTQYKRPTLVRRIARRLSVNKFHTLSEYLDFLFENEKEVRILAREFLIGVTKFFRDTHVWKKLESEVIPELVRLKNDGEVLKVWCVGTSTGEEAYSLAMLISEEKIKQGKKFDVKVFATDLAHKHLEIGSKGFYAESIVADVSRKRLDRFFFRKGEGYQVVDSLRRMVIFSQHNVLRDPPFSKMDIAVCRNMLIYMQSEAQKRVIGLLHYSLNRNGILLLGSSETLGEFKNVMDVIDRKSKIYKNIKPATSLGTNPMKYEEKNTQLPPYLSVAKRSPDRLENRLAEFMNEMVIDELGMAAVFIDDRYTILHVLGEFKKYVELPDKGFSNNLLKILPEVASISMGGILRKAFKENERVIYKAMKIRKKDMTITLDLLLNTFDLDGPKNKGCMLLFMPKDMEVGQAEVKQEPTEGGVQDLRVNELEQELNETRRYLQTVFQDVETGNEELQATNEELSSTNEELQSSNEELQSVNEELHTVNAELQQKIEDLASLNSDMDNLLRSTDIGTIFLDRNLEIRKFTQSARKSFNLRDSDINRPIYHLTNSFGDESDIRERIQKVLDSGQSTERNLRSNDGNWFLERITPYRNGNNTIDGAVISLVDINKIKKAEAAIRKSEEELRALYDNAPDMFVSFDTNGKLINCNNRLLENLGFEDISELQGKSISQLFKIGADEKFEERFAEFKKTGKASNVERNLRCADGSTIPVSMNAEMLYNKNGKEMYIICALRDISELKEVQKKYMDQNHAFQQLLEGTMAGH